VNVSSAASASPFVSWCRCHNAMNAANEQVVTLKDTPWMGSGGWCS